MYYFLQCFYVFMKIYIYILVHFIKLINIYFGLIIYSAAAMFAWLIKAAVATAQSRAGLELCYTNAY